MREEPRLPPELQDAFAIDTAHVAGDCPSAEDIWAAASGEADAPDTRRVALHVATCGACTTAWRLATELTRVTPLMPSIDQAETHRGSRLRRWTSAGSLLAVAAGLAVLVYVDTSRVGPRPAPAAFRVPDRAVVQPLVADGTELPRHEFVLRWAPGPEGSRYDVRVLTSDLTEVTAQQGLAAPELLVAPETLATVPSGSSLFWQVTIVRPDGDRQVSPMFRVRVR